MNGFADVDREWNGGHWKHSYFVANIEIQPQNENGDIGETCILQSVLSKGDRGYDYLTQTEVVSTAWETSSQNELNFVW